MLLSSHEGNYEAKKSLWNDLLKLLLQFNGSGHVPASEAVLGDVWTLKKDVLVSTCHNILLNDLSPTMFTFFLVSPSQ